MRLGFDEEPIQDTFEEESEKYTKKLEKVKKEFKPAYIPERFEARFLEGFDCTVVNDFGDDYHLSEEERKKNNKFYEIFKEFILTKKKYRNVGEFVTVMRMALKCLDAVAEKNGFYDPEEFKEKFFNGEIYINGLTIPKLVGKERKSVDFKYLSEFILSDEPVETLTSSKDDVIYTTEELLDQADTLFDNLDEILEPLTEEEIMKISMDIDEYDDMELRKSMSARELDSKEGRKVLKAIPEILYGIKEIKSDNRKINNASRFIYDLACDDFEEIAKYDSDYGYVSDSDIPEFHGDLMNEDDYNKYLRALEYFEDTQIREIYHGKFKTKEQIEDLEFKEVLERAGYNLRNLYDNKDKERKLRKIEAKEKKREKELKARLLKLKNRKQRRMGDSAVSSKKKKKKSKKHP